VTDDSRAPTRNEDVDDEDGQSRRRRIGALALLGALPWTVLTYGSELNAIFLWASVATSPPQILTLPEYLAVVGIPLSRLPARLLGWPVSTASFCLAVAVEAAGFGLDRDFRRPVAGLIVLAALAHLRVTLGMSRTAGVAVPLGPLAAFGLLWWGYRADPTGHDRDASGGSGTDGRQ